MATATMEPGTGPARGQLARRPLPRRVVVAYGLVAAVAYLVMVTWMFWSPGFSLHQFKSFFANDQESYLAIAVNFSHGDFRSVEPFTQTGSIYYPRLYYQGLGMLSHATHTDPVVWWWIGSLGTQSLLAGVVGATSAAFTRRRWLTMIGPVSLTAGIFGEVRGTSWLTVLQGHSVIWGSFAELFAGNGSTVAVVLDALALIALVGLVSGRIAGRRAVVVGVVVAIVLGAMASVHTYTFLTGTYAVCYVLACFGMLRRAGRVGWMAAGASVLLLGCLFLVGPRLAAGVGPLAVLVLGLLPTAPGLLLVVSRDRRVLGCLVVLGLGAAPQVLMTATGVASGDAFLHYRQASTAASGLSVPLVPGLLHGVVLLGALALVLAAGLAARQPWWTAIALGSAVAWVLLWTNDSWGAAQEPNRFWRNGFTMLLPVAVVVGAWVAAELGRRWVKWAGGAFLLVAVLSLTDYLAFSLLPAVGKTIDYHTPQLEAVASATAHLSTDRGGLVLAGPCLAPRSVKIRTGLPVAYENVGMAWASRHDALLALVPGLWEGHSPASVAALDVAKARRAGVRFVLIDTACAGPDFHDPALRPVRSVEYQTRDRGAARVQLWRLD